MGTLGTCAGRVKAELKTKKLFKNLFKKFLQSHNQTPTPPNLAGD